MQLAGLLPACWAAACSDRTVAKPTFTSLNKRRVSARKSAMGFRGIVAAVARNSRTDIACADVASRVDANASAKTVFFMDNLRTKKRCEGGFVEGGDVRNPSVTASQTMLVAVPGQRQALYQYTMGRAVKPAKRIVRFGHTGSVARSVLPGT